MSQRPSLPLPSALKMPLRDAMRGIAGFAERTEEVLAPAVSALPDTLKSVLHDAAEAIEAGGGIVLGPNVTQEDIARASAFLRGTALSNTDATACAKVLAYGWDRLKHQGALDVVVSETLTAARLSASVSPDQAPAQRAASILMDLRASNVVGTFPGLPVTESAPERAKIDFHLFCLAMWLLSEREANLDAEMRLLDLAVTLGHAFQDDVANAYGSHEALTQTLANLSDHL